MIYVANPIYDSVFKYLMEDEYYSAIEDRDTAIMSLTRRSRNRTVRLKSSVSSYMRRPRNCMRRPSS